MLKNADSKAHPPEHMREFYKNLKLNYEKVSFIVAKVEKLECRRKI
jgi:hypothetical protein